MSTQSPPPSSPRPSRAQARSGFLASAFDDPSMDRYRTAQARRRVSFLSILTSLILITVPVALIASPSVPSWAFAVAAAILYIPWMFVTGMLNGSVSGIFDLKEAQLDETERQDRDAAYRTAYRVMIGVSAITFGVAIGMVASGAGAGDTGWFPWILWVGGIYLFTLILLPVHIAAWRLAARGDMEEASASPESHGS